MHVALVFVSGNQSFAGGVPAVVWQRATQLVADGHQATIVCSSFHDWTNPETRDGIRIIPIKAPVGRIDGFFARRLATRCPMFLAKLGQGLELAHAEKRIDLVDLQDGPAILGAGPFCRKRKVPMAFTIHGSAALNPAPRPKIGRLLHKFYESRAWVAADLVLPVSSFIATAGERYGNFHDKIRRVPNAIPRERAERQKARSPGPLRLLFLARVAPEKRLDTLLHAMVGIEPSLATLDVVGGGPSEGEMRSLAQSLNLADRVRFHGFVEDRTQIGDFLAKADVFVFPTEFEAMSMALLEAIAYELYPLASDIPANAEILPSQYLFPLGDATSLRREILKLAKDPSQLSIGRDERSRLAQRHSPDRIFEELKLAYLETIARHKRNPAPYVEGSCSSGLHA